MFKWIEERVERYCNEKFNEASMVIDKACAQVVVALEDHCILAVELEKKEFEEDVKKSASKCKKKLECFEKDFMSLLESLDVNEELKSAFSSYVADNKVTISPIVIFEKADFNAFKQTHEVEFMRVGSYQSKARWSSNSEDSELIKKATKESIYTSSKKAIKDGEKIGSDLIVVNSCKFNVETIGKEYQQRRVKGEGNTNFTFYKVTKQKITKEKEQ